MQRLARRRVAADEMRESSVTIAPNRTRVGLIGAGGIASAHALSLLAIPGILISAVADPLPGRAKAIAGRFGDAKVFRSHREMLGCGDIDVAHIAETFGGGGHRQASGAMVPGPLANAQQKVIDSLLEALARRAGLPPA